MDHTSPPSTPASLNSQPWRPTNRTQRPRSVPDITPRTEILRFTGCEFGGSLQPPWLAAINGFIPLIYLIHFESYLCSLCPLAVTYKKITQWVERCFLFSLLNLLPIPLIGCHKFQYSGEAEHCVFPLFRNAVSDPSCFLGATVQVATTSHTNVSHRVVVVKQHHCSECLGEKWDLWQSGIFDK